MPTRLPLILLTVLFFGWGLITSLNDILVPHLKQVFTLSYTQAMLVQLSFFTAYFLVSVPAGWLVHRVGYARGLSLGLLTAAAGCLLFVPASSAPSYPMFLGALFVLASGITTLQVAANPYVTVLGSAETASSRLTLTQAFNSLGTTIGPFLGAMLILDDRTGAGSEASRVQLPYLLLAVALVLLAVIVMRLRLPQPEAPAGTEEEETAAREPGAPASAWGHPHLVLGALAIFAYVGAEVSIGSFLVSFMGRSEIAGLSPATAGRYLSFYWGAAMVGRFLGAAVLRRVSAARALAFNAATAVLLVGFAAMGSGPAAMVALLLVGLCNSIMFPTIFALALEGLGRLRSDGSGILCMAIVGGAVMPVLQGFVADRSGLAISFVLPALCYVYIFYYGARGYLPLRGWSRT